MKVNWIDARYGTRRSFIRSEWYNFLSLFGHYRQDNISWDSVERLVFVCTGNICRSAFAEAVARSMGVDAISAGIHAIFNVPANTQAVSTAKQMGYDLSAHRTTPIVYLSLRKSDLLVAMEPWQAYFVKTNLARHHQITLLGLWGKRKRPYIADPYNRSPEYFLNCFEYISGAVKNIADKVSCNKTDSPVLG